MLAAGDTILIDNVDGKLTARIKQHLKRSIRNVIYKESAIGRSSNPIMVTSSGAGRFMTACACICVWSYTKLFLRAV